MERPTLKKNFFDTLTFFLFGRTMMYGYPLNFNGKHCYTKNGNKSAHVILQYIKKPCDINSSVFILETLKFFTGDNPSDRRIYILARILQAVLQGNAYFVQASCKILARFESSDH